MTIKIEPRPQRVKTIVGNVSNAGKELKVAARGSTTC